MTEKGMKNGGGEQENLSPFSAKALKDRNLGCMCMFRIARRLNSGQRIPKKVNFCLPNTISHLQRKKHSDL
jgi:hypothetical protein